MSEVVVKSEVYTRAQELRTLILEKYGVKADIGIHVFPSQMEGGITQEKAESVVAGIAGAAVHKPSLHNYTSRTYAERLDVTVWYDVDKCDHCGK